MSKDQTALMTIDGLPTATIPQTWRYKANDPGYYALNSLHPTQVAGPAAAAAAATSATYGKPTVAPGTPEWNDAALFRTGIAGARYGIGRSANMGAAVVRDKLPTGNVLDTPWSTASQAGIHDSAGLKDSGAPGTVPGSSSASARDGTGALGAGWGVGGSTTWQANNADIGTGSGVRADPADWTFGAVGDAIIANAGPDGSPPLIADTKAAQLGSGRWVTSSPVAPGSYTALGYESQEQSIGQNAILNYAAGLQTAATMNNLKPRPQYEISDTRAGLGSKVGTGAGDVGILTVDKYLDATQRDMLPTRKATAEYIPADAAASAIRGGRKRRRKRRKSRSKKGWAKRAPRGRARTRMLKKCGKKCFLGPKKSFPICAKRTCKINRKGVKAAYIRAKQWGKPRKSYKSKSKTVARRSRKRRKGSRPRHRRRVYTRVARKAKSLLRRMKR